MTKAKTAATHLGCRKANDPATGDVTVVIESPRGSPHKYTYDQDIGAFRLAAILPEGITFPFDFGFVPSTRGEDGYPLDVMVLLDYPVPIGCVLTVRLIGVIEAEQREPDGKWVQNDRFLGVATHAHAHSVTTDLDALRPGLLDELEGFFGHYNQMRGKEFRPLAREGPKKAGKAVHRGMKLYKDRKGS
jgi:inorganic pyrophosphatase